jgi:hypothetical protein
MCWMPPGDPTVDGEAPEAAGVAGTTLICATTAPLAWVKGQDVLLTATALLLPFQKPAKQELQPEVAKQRKSKAGKALRETLAADGMAPVPCILGLTSGDEVRIPLSAFLVLRVYFCWGFELFLGLKRINDSQVTSEGRDDHGNGRLFSAQRVTCRCPEPSVSITHTSIGPVRLLWNAMRLPSGNQYGVSSRYGCS